MKGGKKLGREGKREGKGSDRHSHDYIFTN